MNIKCAASQVTRHVYLGIQNREFGKSEGVGGPNTWLDHTTATLNTEP